MLKILNIKLEECPIELQKAVNEKLSGYEKGTDAYKIITVKFHESHIYFDKSKTLKTYTVIIQETNTFTIYTAMDCMHDGNYHISQDMVNAGDIQDIIEAAPEWFTNMNIRKGKRKNG